MHNSSNNTVEICGYKTHTTFPTLHAENTHTFSQAEKTKTPFNYTAILSIHSINTP